MGRIVRDDTTDDDLLQVMKESFDECPLIRRTDMLKKVLFYTLKSLYIDDVQYVIIEAPTGTGKTIIAFMLCKCVDKLLGKKAANKDELSDKLLYYLTSSKALQEQIANDIERFGFYPTMAMLKGTSNYVCTPLQERWMPGFPENYYYNDRLCIGVDKNNLLEYPCYSTCPYLCARDVASESMMAILNYHYFLTVMRGDPTARTYKPFDKRHLTICDEAHLIPDIVCDMFNLKLTLTISQKVRKFANSLFNTETRRNLNEAVTRIESLFKYPTLTIEGLRMMIRQLNIISKLLSSFTDVEVNKGGTNFVQKAKLVEYLDNYMNNVEVVENLLKRQDDLFIESNFSATINGENYYTHTIRDLSETEVIKNNFICNLDKAVFMSATIGKTNEFVKLFGLDGTKYRAFSVPSTFDFKQSPINCMRSGYLNYSNFRNNIDGVLRDTIKIVEGKHSRECGIIHTVTKDIATMFKNKIQNTPNPSRYLFYDTSEQKEECIALLKTSPEKFYVIVGYSLYEGIDLYDDQGRFNILIKVPYAALTEYIKRKIERYPFWYNRATSEKVIQAIGRTNRHTNDYSVTYLMDSSFPDFIRKNISNNIILSRLKYTKI
jgi:Rad3-related DNA helicase